jgi:hypothetical protein
MKKKIVILIFVIAFQSCNTNKAKSLPFERQKELLKYFDCLNLKFDETINHVFIFQTNKCGSCTDEVMDYIVKEYKKNDDKKTFIVSTNTKPIINVLKTIKNNKIYIDVDYNLEKYGLSFAKDLYVQMKNNKIESWTFLDHSTVK